MSKFKFSLTYLIVLICIGSYAFIQYNESKENSSTNYEDIIMNFKLTNSIILNEEIEKKETFLLFIGSKECTPCAELAPILLDVGYSKNRLNKISYLSIDDKKNKILATEEYGLIGTPTLLLFKKGKIVDRYQGTLDKKELITIVNKL